MQIGEKIKLYRNFRGYTQESLAKSIGMNPNNYAKMEQGTLSPTYELLEKLAEELKVNVLDLVSFDEKRMVNIIGQHNEQINQLINVVNGINNYCTDTEKERDAFKSHIDTLKQENLQKQQTIESQNQTITTLNGIIKNLTK